MENVRIGIIGIGNMGSAHMACISEGRIQGLVLGALCDSDPSRLALCQERCPDVPRFSDYHEMIRSGLIDAVLIAVPHRLHAQIAIEALQNGLHTLTEKPGDVTITAVKKLIEVAKGTDRVFGIMFNQRTNPLFAKAREIVRSGQLGELKRSVWIITNWYRSQHYYDSGSWRATWAGEGGGVLLNQAPHNLDLWQWICGMPTKIQSKTIYGSHRDIIVDNDVTIVAEYANGATGSFVTCTHDAVGTDRLEIDLDNGKIVVEDSKKATIYRFTHGEDEMNNTMSMQQVSMLVRGMGGGKLYETETIENQDGWGIQHGTVLTNFAAKVLGEGELLAPGSDGINGVMLANAALLSSWLGKEIELPVDEDLYIAELNKRIEAEGKFPTIK